MSELLFRYNDRQWADIQLPIASLDAERTTVWCTNGAWNWTAIRGLLDSLASSYLNWCKREQQFDQRHLAELFRGAAKHAEELRNAVEQIEGYALSTEFGRRPWIVADFEPTSCGAWANSERGGFGGLSDEKYWSLVDFTKSLSAFVGRHAELHDDAVVDRAPNEKPTEGQFLRFALKTWLELGGEAKGDKDGPAVLFLSAVTGPPMAMEKTAMSPNTIRSRMFRLKREFGLNA